MAAVGAHIGRRKGIVDTFKEVLRVGGNVLQIFVSNPRSGKVSAAAKRRYLAEAPAVRAFLAEGGDGGGRRMLFVHSAYTLNFARNMDVSGSAMSYWVKALLEELEIADALGAKGVVIHMGKYVAARPATPEQGMANMAKSLSEILKARGAGEAGGAHLILETSSGMGSELCADLSELVGLYRRLRHISDKVSICFDTAHVHAAGATGAAAAGSVPEALRWLAKRIGTGRNGISLIQINNNPTPAGAHKDRHIGLLDDRGQIPRSDLEAVVAFAKRRGVPLVLETPNESYKKDIPWMLAVSQ